MKRYPRCLLGTCCVPWNEDGSFAGKWAVGCTLAFVVLLAGGAVTRPTATLAEPQPPPPDYKAEFFHCCDLACEELNKEIIPFEEKHRTVTEPKAHHMPFFEDSYAVRALAVDAGGRKTPDWPFHDAKPVAASRDSLRNVVGVRALPQAMVPGVARTDSPIQLVDVVALPVKDPFYLPRALIYCIDVLERLVATQTNKQTTEN